MTEDDEHSPRQHPPAAGPVRGDGGGGGGGGGEADRGGDAGRGGDHGDGRGGGGSPGSDAGTDAAAGAARTTAAADGGAGDGQDGTGPPARRLTRSRRPKAVAGVCSGLGRYFDLDPVIFRVPLVVLSVIGGLGLVFYGAAWLLIPAEDEQQNEARWLLSGRVEGTTLSAILVALVGCGLFLASLGSLSTPFSVLLAGAVAGAAYWSQHRREAEAAEAVGAPIDPTTAHAVADAPPEAQAPPVPGMPSWWREPLTKDGAGDTGYLWGPEEAETQAGRGHLPHGRPWGRGGGGPRPGRRREGAFGGLLAMLAAAAAVAGTAAGWDPQALGTGLTIGLACALAVYGIGFAVSAFAGRVGLGTLFLAVVTAVMLAGVSLIPKSIGTDWREVTWAPASASDIAGTYELDGGAGELDLGDIRFTGDHKTVRTHARLGAGALKVIVPSGTRVELDAKVGAGEIRLPSRTEREGEHFVVESIGGVDRHERLTLSPGGSGKDEEGTLKLSVDLTVGQLEIVRVLSSGARTDHLPARSVPGDGRSEERR
ncbi:PspC domain-containing protein [Streptomyces bathyalis]|uniref:PspC domain-containing protein n=1 Tax=Streptomyces bathyalis TaxID=2710756 RepID=A0A7T1WRW1_9ACTN|nr:PspC domain-containing protein [Streptomyces bathyalis]QPP06939.1 PspC domain-containing protein [Streptomyces bathyalis]